MRLFQSGVGNMDLIVKSTHINTTTTTLSHKHAQTCTMFTIDDTNGEQINNTNFCNQHVGVWTSLPIKKKLLIWLKHAWKPTKWIRYESALKTGYTNLYSKWYTYISDMDKNVKDHYAKPSKKLLILNLVSILGTLPLLYFNKLVLGLINFKLGGFRLDPLEVKNCSSRES